MKNNAQSQSGIFAPRVVGAFLLCSAGVVLAMLSLAATPPNGITGAGGKTPGTSLFVDRYAQPISGNAKAGAASVPLVQSATSGWSIVDSPNYNNSTASFHIEGVSCTSATSCWAVGHYYDSSGGLGSTLTERWNGNRWYFTYSPNYNYSIHASLPAHLTAISCVADEDCWAVGYYFDSFANNIKRAFGLHRQSGYWNGGAFPYPHVGPNEETSILTDVNCISSSQCWAVGYYTNENGIEQTLIEQGSSWSVVSSPNTSSTQKNVLSRLKCNSGTDCWAVGSYVGDNGKHQTLIEHWDGISWSIVTSPNTNNLEDNQLNGVACASSSDCWSVGNYTDDGGYARTLIEHWSGSSWSITNSPNTSASEDNILNGAGCLSASECVAAGYHVTSGGIKQTLTERWNGTSWAIVSAPNNNTTHDNFLDSVTCVSGAGCWAVGDYFNENGLEQTLVEQWDSSSWATNISANGTSYNPLNDIACASVSDCWAVDLLENFAGGVAAYTHLFEHWDGVSWTLVDSIHDGYPSRVTCVSGSDCWAVGYGFNNNTYNHITQTLIEHWNGNSWERVTSPNPGSDGDILNSVSCASASDCWAAGSYAGAGGTGGLLLEHWNGNSWSALTLPDQASGNVLNDITCNSTSDCWAVGYVNSGSLHMLIEHWNGTSWSIVLSSDSIGRLYSVTCTSPSDCWAVGGVHFQHWDGHSWSSVTPTDSSKGVTRVSCAATSDCWAVGFYEIGGAYYQTVIEHWDGTSWNLIDSPNGEVLGDNQFLGVACPSASECWGVGGSTDGYTYQTLIARYVPPVQLPSVVSRKTHGGAGTFDVTLPFTGRAGVECRTGGASGAHQVIATFANPVTFSNASIASGSGSVSDATINGSQVTLNLTGVANAQTIILRFTGVSDGTNSADINVPMGVLLGDTTGDGAVNASDISQTKMQSGQPVSGSNFREDVNVSGVVNSSDLTAVKAVVGTALP